MALTPGQLQECLKKAVEAALTLGAKPEIAYGETGTADEAFLTIVPPAGEYVYLMSAIGSVGSDGDRIEMRVLDKDGVERTVFNPRALGNTPVGIGAPNLKLDKVRIGADEYAVKPGDGETEVVKFYSRGTGPWNLTVIYYCGK
jgi:hypothetical protein